MLRRRFLLGANYWPRRRGVAMWRDWQPAEVAEELAALAGLGLAAVRVFLRWADFQPEPGRVDPAALARLAEFCDLARRHGLGVIPTFFTGHMSGENWDVPWRGGRCPYTDPALLRAQVRLARAVAERLRGHPALLAWDLANEPDVFHRPPSADAGWLWARLLYLELKAVTPDVPVTLGIHVTSLAEDCGLRPADLAEANDFLCMHLYPIYSPLCPDPADTVRPTLLVPCGDRLVAGMGGREALAEEFGATTLMMSPQRHARYLGSVLASLLLHGSLGALVWCACDFACAQELPYDSTPYEVAFGLLDADLRPKPAAAVVQRFARLLAALPGGRPRPAPAQAAILIPERYYENPDPDVTPGRHFAVLFNAFVLARRAGIDVDFVQAEGAWERYRLLFLPCVPRRGALSVRTWQRLADWVATGGTLYASYDGMALPGMEEVFGLRVEDAYPREADADAPWALQPEGGDDGAAPWAHYRGLGRKRLRVAPAGARVVARLAGEPAVLVHRYGAGQALFVTDPVEAMLAATPGAYRHDASHRLYALAAAAAGVQPRWAVGHPDVEVRGLTTDRGEVVLLVSHAAEDLAVALRPPAGLPPGTRLVDLETGEAWPAVAARLELPACGWRALQVVPG